MSQFNMHSSVQAYELKVAALRSGNESATLSLQAMLLQ